ncbi:hypothetical protein [Promicromonospora sukumoe]|uniref:Uncharacterized protein n=1 Tax=Promicromonospora sukumoe TaxID=88382 RepID=A0A7W3J605_9MICO|nr:hypothetical protein [Promicromonospora sukumoe]MBA8806926.1 hypothetical protein [Promicromonospora sukumoe]
MHAVILPATPLLVPGTAPGLRGDPLSGVRAAVADALARLTEGGRVPLVLAHGPALRSGRMRPSLAGSGIGERWLGGGGVSDEGRPAAGTGASVALLALADVLGARAADVEVLEVPPSWPGSSGTGPDADAVRLLRAADGLVVAGGGVPGGLDSDPGALTDGVRAALRAAGADAWTSEVQVFAQSHDHLPPEYRVTTLA